METKNNPRTDDSTESSEWGIIDDLQAMLAKACRQHERGDSLNIQDVLRQAGCLLDKARSADTQQVISQSVRDLLAAYWEHVAVRKICAPTGLASLNEALGGGLESKRLVVLLGAPGAGKTTLANQIADHVADAGRPVLYVTSEDRPHDLMAKTLARIGSVNYTVVLKGWESERAKINAALAMQAERQSSDCLRYVDASGGLSLEAMKALAQEHFSRCVGAGSGVLVVDYLQRFARAQRDLLGASRDLREIVSLLTERLRAIAVDLDCCVLALASQNRASGYSAGGASALASAKESGDIEYACDVLMSISKEDESKLGSRKPGSSLIKPWVLRIDKNRQGQTIEKLELDWQPDRQMFTDAVK